MKRSVSKLIAALVAAPLLGMVVLLLSQAPAMSATGDDGAATFKAKCVMCHGADGSGDTSVGKSLKIRDLRSGEVQSQSDGQLLEIISNGKGKMPAYEKGLGADKCKDLVTFIRGLKH